MTDVKAKIMEVVETPQLSAFATIKPDGKPWVRYVMTAADSELTFRISTSKSSRKVADVELNPEVHLTLGVMSLESARHYVQIQGRAEVTQDDAERKACWNDHLSNYFKGPDDPNYAIIKVVPYRIEYQGMTSMNPEVWER